MAELDAAAAGSYAFVNVTVFGDDGWAVREEMWSSHLDEPLDAFLSGLTNLSTGEAQRVAGDFLSTWEHGGEREEGARLARRLSLVVVSALVGAGVLAVLGTEGVRSILTSPRATPQREARGAATCGRGRPPLAFAA
jgi:hypothetical protein